MMNNIFRDQLLKAGVVTEEQVDKVAQDEAKKREQAKQRRLAAQNKNKQKKKPQKAKKPAAQQPAAKVESKAITRDVSKHDQVDRILKESAIAPGNKENYSFTLKSGQLRQVSVSKEQIEALAAGEMAIITTRQSMNPYTLVQKPEAEKIKVLREERIALWYQD